MKKYIHPKRKKVTVVLSSGESYNFLSCINDDYLYSYMDNKNHELWTKTDTSKSINTAKKNDFKFFDNILND